MSLEQENRVKELFEWDFPNTVSIPDGYDLKTVPEATGGNVMVLMEKINELVQEINYLKEKYERNQT